MTAGAGPPRVGVVGGGTMGVGIAYVFAAAGAQVTLVEPDATRAATALRTARDQAVKAVERGKLDPGAGHTLPDRLTAVADVTELVEGLDLVVESVPERLELKRQVLAAAEKRGPRLLASNTSGLPIADLGAGLERPADFLGLHFFNPVWSMPLVEIVRAPATAAEQRRRGARGRAS